MSARDELAEVIASKLDRLFGHREFGPAKQDFDLADELISAGYSKPRTVMTRYEVEALPDGSVLLDSAGDVAHLRDGFWFSYETSPMTHHRMAKYTPATVLHEPKSA